MMTLSSRVRHGARRIDAWLFGGVPPHALGLFRAIFGSFLLLYWLTKAPRVTMLFSDRGLVLPLVDSPFLMPPPVSVAWLLYGVMLVSLLCVALGWRTRIAGCIALFLSAYYWFLSLHLFDTSFDRLFLFFLAVLAIDGADHAFTLPLWLRGRTIADGTTSAFAQRLIAIQVTATYAGVGWQKFLLTDWAGSETLWYSLQNTWATPVAFAVAAFGLPLSFFGVVTFIVKIFECLLPIGLWHRSLQPWFFAFGALFHLLVTVLLGMWWFLAMPATYLLFLDPSTVASWSQKNDLAGG